MKRLQVLVAWLLISALPLQALAAAGMSWCAVLPPPTPESPVARVHHGSHDSADAARASVPEDDSAAGCSCPHACCPLAVLAGELPGGDTAREVHPGPAPQDVPTRVPQLPRKRPKA